MDEYTNIFDPGGCPMCGCDLMGKADSDGSFTDGDTLVCNGCGIHAWVVVDSGGAYADWDDVEQPATGEE